LCGTRYEEGEKNEYEEGRDEKGEGEENGRRTKMMEEEEGIIKRRK
jgi:hypothetical protein